MADEHRQDAAVVLAQNLRMNAAFQCWASNWREMKAAKILKTA